MRKEMPKVLFVISYSIAEQRHLLHTVPVSTESFDARADLPEAWAGLRDAEPASGTPVTAASSASRKPAHASGKSARASKLSGLTGTVCNRWRCSAML